MSPLRVDPKACTFTTGTCQRVHWLARRKRLGLLASNELRSAAKVRLIPMRFRLQRFAQLESDGEHIVAVGSQMRGESGQQLSHLRSTRAVVNEQAPVGAVDRAGAHCLPEACGQQPSQQIQSLLRFTREPR